MLPLGILASLAQFSDLFTVHLADEHNPIVRWLMTSGMEFPMKIAGTAFVISIADICYHSRWPVLGDLVLVTCAVVGYVGFISNGGLVL